MRRKCSQPSLRPSLVSDFCRHQIRCAARADQLAGTPGSPNRHKSNALRIMRARQICTERCWPRAPGITRPSTGLRRSLASYGRAASAPWCSPGWRPTSASDLRYATLSTSSISACCCETRPIISVRTSSRRRPSTVSRSSSAECSRPRSSCARSRRRPRLMPPSPPDPPSDAQGRHHAARHRRADRAVVGRHPRHVLEIIKAVIKVAGGTLADVAFNHVFLTDWKDYGY